ncbi:LysR family transcriptional regulator [Phaeovulum sp. W22_SRMD_FR3]|uniref:LysR family transcriptional regulator n=1 Tax=Phaeovulum sp. W22_SRMD_FR3 TaxID=3240274 RepID=UPI003F99880C
MINLHRIDLNLLSLLVAVHDTGSVSLAGRTLGLSQPATSNALGRLRDALQDKLFVRGPGGMEPTALTARIVPEIRLHLAGIADTLTRAPVFDPATTRRTFRMALSGLGEQIFLTPLVERVFALAPGVRLGNVASPFEDLKLTLQQRQADVAMGLLPPDGANLMQTHLFNEDYRVIGPPGKRATTAVDLSRARLILVSGATYAEDIEQVVADHGLTENVCLRLRHFGALPDLLGTVDALAIVPGQFGRRLAAAGKARLLDIVLPRGRQKVLMVWHANTDADPGCIWLRGVIRDLFQETDRDG